MRTVYTPASVYIYENFKMLTLIDNKFDFTTIGSTIFDNNLMEVDIVLLLIVMFREQICCLGLGFSGERSI